MQLRFLERLFLLAIISINQVYAENDHQLVLEPLDCSKESQLRSQSGEGKAIISFRNGSPDSVAIHWINYLGKRDIGPKQVTVIEPDMTSSRSTYFTHPFVATKLNGECMGIYIPQSRNNIVFFK